MRKNLPVLSARKRDKDGLTDRIAASAKPTRPSAGDAPLLSPAVVTRNKVMKMADVEPLPDTEQAPDRIPLEEVYMRMAEELAKRSTCARLQVGSVITTADLTQVLGIGYNGNARGLPNRCDSSEPGNCGCLHSEQNALIKAGAQLPGKVMFVSASPCVMCAKMIINANVGRVYFREAYRDPAGLNVLRQAGVEVIHYDRWRDLWR
jgi:dCMP deaminase